VTAQTISREHVIASLSPPASWAITVHTPPVPKARPRLGRGRVFTPRTTELAEHRIRETFEREVGGAPLAGPIELHVVVYLAQPASLAKRDRLTARPTRRPDLDNFVKVALDALNGAAFTDDAQVVRIVAEKRYAIDSAPRWHIALDQVAT
jgi:Holliday junction resolvase RusA-like endonuclease